MNLKLQKKYYCRRNKIEYLYVLGLDIENKYLKRLYVFKEFKQAQEKEIEELTQTMKQCESDTKVLAEELEENLKNLVARAKEVSLTLILSKSGKRINEKVSYSFLLILHSFRSWKIN